MSSTSKNAPDEAREAWFRRHLATAPPRTWEQWVASNAALGIKVTRAKA